MPLEYPLIQLLQEAIKKTFKRHTYVAYQWLGSQFKRTLKWHILIGVWLPSALFFFNCC